MAIGMRMRPLAIKNWPERYTKCDYLESTGTQYMYVPVDGTTRDDITIEAAKHDVTPMFSQLIVISNALGYDFSDMCHSNDTLENGQVSVGWRLDPLSVAGVDRPPVYQWNAFPKYAADTRYRQDWHGKTRQLYFNSELVSTFSGSDKTPDCVTTSVRLFKGGGNSAGMIYSVKYVREDGDTLIDMIPALDPDGVPCMVDFVTQTPFYNENTSGSDFLYKAYSYPFNPGNNWHAFRRKLTDIIDDTKYVAEVVTENGVDKFVLHTDRLADDKLQAVNELLDKVILQNIEVVKYNHHIEISWRDINKYAACKNTNEMAAVNPDWKNDLTSDGEWWWNLTRLQQYGIFQDNQKITVFNADLCNGWHSVYCMFLNCRSLREVHGDFSNFRSAMNMCNGCKSLSVFTPVMPLLPTHSDGPDWVFSNCILNKQSVLSFLGALPPANRMLGIGIHVDHRNDEEILAAITRMEENGWTMGVQWNGTPTAQASVTYGLRKPPIYARMSEIERPDGTTERVLEWAHYVTDPTGYEEFRSVEAAREYFGLPEPEDSI